MAEEFDPVVAPEEGRKTNTVLIIAIVVVVLCCCCCAVVAGLYYGAEPLMELLGIDIPWYY